MKRVTLEIDDRFADVLSYSLSGAGNTDGKLDTFYISGVIALNEPEITYAVGKDGVAKRKQPQ